VCTRLGFDAGAFGGGFGRCDDGVCFCVGLGLKVKEHAISFGCVRGAWEGTYVAGFGLDTGDRKDTLFLLNLVAVFPIDIL
jgi:hypothetical protein